jgi:hypothetical protein
MADRMNVNAVGMGRRGAPDMQARYCGKITSDANSRAARS